MMYFKKLPDPMGDYVDAAGNRFSLSAARRIRTAAGVNIGYAPFDSINAALQAWGLTVWKEEVLP